MLSLQMFVFLPRCILTWLNVIAVYLLSFVSILIVFCSSDFFWYSTQHCTALVQQNLQADISSSTKAILMLYFTR